MTKPLPDWKLWSWCPALNHEEFVALSLGIEPTTICRMNTYERISGYAIEHRGYKNNDEKCLVDEFAPRLFQLNHPSNARREYRTVELVRRARSVNWEIPPELVAMATNEARNTEWARKNTNDVTPDERHQYLFSRPDINRDEWLAFDLWSLEHAVLLITLGYPADLDRLADSINKFEPQSLMRYGLAWSIKVSRRALAIAETSIALGKIKNPDTPENWIKWARTKGYAVKHLTDAMPDAQEPRTEPQEVIKVVSRHAGQDEAVLAELRAQKYDPMKLPKSRPGKPGAKAAVRAKLIQKRKDLFLKTSSTFDKTWDRLRKSEAIKDA